MYKTVMLKKALVLFIMLLFVGASAVSGIDVNENNHINTSLVYDEDSTGQDTFLSGTRWDINWTYHKKIIIDHTKVAADLFNYPVLIF